MAEVVLQEMLALQEELHQERRRVKEAESGLEDGFVQVDNLERQLNRAVKKMQRAATGLHHAIHPFYKVGLPYLFCPSLHVLTLIFAHDLPACRLDLTCLLTLFSHVILASTLCSRLFTPPFPPHSPPPIPSPVDLSMPEVYSLLHSA